MQNYKKQSYTIIDFYFSYMESVKDNELYQVEYKVFRALLVDYFRYLRDEIIENCKEVRLPCRLGYLSIIKHKPKTYTNRSLRIDYGESKKQGKMIFHLNEHTNEYKYRFYWDKKNMITTNKTHYQLIMTRANKRRLATLLKHNLRDYPEL